MGGQAVPHGVVVSNLEFPSLMSAAGGDGEKCLPPHRSPYGFILYTQSGRGQPPDVRWRFSNLRIGWRLLVNHQRTTASVTAGWLCRPKRLRGGQGVRPDYGLVSCGKQGPQSVTAERSEDSCPDGEVGRILRCAAE
jgi:hypothetical protein